MGVEANRPAATEFRLAGVLLRSAEQWQADTANDWEAMRQALSNPEFDPSKFPMPRLPAMPVFSDEEGRPHMLVMTPDGPAAAPWDVGAPLDPGGDHSAGGFLPLDAIGSAAAGFPARSGGIPLGALASAAQSVARGGSSNGGDSDGAFAGMLQGALVGQAQGLMGQALAGLLGGGGPGAGLPGVLSIVEGGCTGPIGGPGGFDFASIGLGALGQAMRMATQALFSAWKVDDSSSTEEQLAHKYAQEAVGKLQSELQSQLASSLGLGTDPGSIWARIGEFFGGATSSASVPVGRLTDPDTADGVVTSGAPSVLVNGLLAARQDDLATMTKPSVDAGPVQTGNPTILAVGQPLTGVGHVAMGQSQGIMVTISSGSPNVLMGVEGVPSSSKQPAGLNPGQSSNGSSERSDPSGGACPVNDGDDKDPLQSLFEEAGKEDGKRYWMSIATKGTSFPGHAHIEVYIEDPVAGQTRFETWGKWPETNQGWLIRKLDTFFDLGSDRDILPNYWDEGGDYPDPYHYPASYSRPISAQQFSDFKSFVESHQSDWSLSSQCVDFAVEAFNDTMKQTVFTVDPSSWITHWPSDLRSQIENLNRFGNIRGR